MLPKFKFIEWIVGFVKVVTVNCVFRENRYIELYVSWKLSQRIVFREICYIELCV